jgi:potassium efflux system protein
VDETLFTIHETPITLVNIATFLGIVVLSFFIAKGIERGMRMSKKLSGSALYGLGRLAYYAVFLIGFYIALTTIGIDLTGVAVVVGALSVGIGFGLQAIFNNFVAGIIILLEKKIHPGDFIELQTGDNGVVLEINVRTTVIETIERQRIVIPNTEMIAKNLVIGGKFHRITLPFSTSRDVEKEKVRKLATEAIENCFQVNKSHPIEVWLAKLSDTTAQYELIVWGSKKQTGAEYLWALESHFSKASIKLSFA